MLSLLPFTNLICFVFSACDQSIYISYQLRRTQRSVIVLYLADSGLGFPGSQVTYSAFFWASNPTASLPSSTTLYIFPIKKRHFFPYNTSISPSPFPSPPASPSLNKPPHHPLVFPVYQKVFFLSSNPTTVVIYPTPYLPSSLSLSHLPEGLLSLNQSK